MKSAILLEAGDIIEFSRGCFRQAFWRGCKTPRIREDAAEVLRMSRRRRKVNRSKQPEVDFVNALKRFLVRADV